MPLVPAIVSRKPAARALMLSAATLPSCRQTVPPSGFSSCRCSRHQHAHVVVVGAQIGRAQVAIRLEQIGVDGHHRDLRLPLAQQIRRERRIRRRDRDRGDAPGQQVVDDLDLARLVGARRRAGVETLVLRVRVLRLPLLAAQVDLLEERVVEPLDHDRQRLLVLGRSRPGGDRQRRGGGEHDRFSHECLPEIESAFRSRTRHEPARRPPARQPRRTTRRNPAGPGSVQREAVTGD